MRSEDKYWSHSEEEVEEVMRIVRRTKRKTILEIGCFKFAMTGSFLINGVSEPRPLVIAMDPRDHDSDKRELLTKSFGKKFQFIQADSHSCEAKNRLTNILQGQKIDILYVDGDHKVPSVEQDTLEYIKYMDDDGYVIWHDAIQNSTVFRYHFSLLGNRFPISLHFIRDSLIAYIQVKQFREAEERAKKWMNEDYENGRWRNWPRNTPGLDFWSAIAA